MHATAALLQLALPWTRSRDNDPTQYNWRWDSDSSTYDENPNVRHTNISSPSEPSTENKQDGCKILFLL
jgi:hypothetical protein